MALNLNLVKFKKSLSKSQYNDLATKDANTLYFISDTQEFYLGSKLYADGAAVLSISGKRGHDIIIEGADIKVKTGENTYGSATTSAITNDNKIVAKAELDAQVNALENKIKAAITGAANYLGVLEPVYKADAPTEIDPSKTFEQLSATASKGDFYRVNFDLRYGGKDYHVGDILIAEKTGTNEDKLNRNDYTILHNEINTDTITEIGIANFNPGEGKQPITPTIGQLQRDSNGNITGFQSGVKVVLGDAANKQVTNALGGSESDGTLPTSEAVKTYVGGVEAGLQKAIEDFKSEVGDTNFVNTLKTSDHTTGEGAVNITSTASTGNLILGNAAGHVVETAGAGISNATSDDNKAKLPTSGAVKEFVTSELVAPKTNIATNAANILEIAHALTWDYEG